MTLYDAERSGFQVQTEAVIESTAVISYDNARTEGSEYLSAIIQDDTTKAYTHYGRLKKLSSPADKSGTVEITLPSDMTGKTLYVFNEQYNGDYLTDYSSELKKVSTVPDAYRVEYKGMNGLVTDGKRYHKKGDTSAYSAKLSVSDETTSILPDTITVTVGGQPLSSYTYNAASGEITITNVTGDVVITANAVAKSYEISAGEAESSGTIAFAGKHDGYAESPNQTVTLTNTGNQTVSGIAVTLEDTDSFTLDTESMKTSLERGGKTSFKLQPKQGLTLGTYTGKVSITGNNITGKEISLTFTVADHSYPAGWSYDSSSHWRECDCGARSEKSGHSFVWVTDKKAEIGTTGVKHEECSICGYAKGNVEIPALETPMPTPTSTPVPTAPEPEETGTESVSAATAEEKQSAREGLNRPVQAGKSYNRIRWAEVKGADGYIIYSSRCNQGRKKHQLKKLTTITSGQTTSYTHKGLKKNSWYKYKVTAYKLVDGKKVRIGSSLCLHSLTKGGRKYANPSGVKVSKAKITLKKGKSTRIKAKAVLPKGKKTRRHTAEIRYVVSKPGIVSVSKKGKITGKKKGSCTVYAVAQNGVYRKIKIKVK